MKNNEIKFFSKIVLLVNGIILLISCIILLIMKKYSWLIGYLLGSVTSYITYLMHAHHADKFGFNSRSSTKKSIASALLRLVISAASLFIALYVSWIDLIATFIGLLVIRLTVLVVSLIIGIKKEKGGNVVENESN